MTELTVTSNVGRDLLQAAQHFRTDRTVIWEYVANSLQYSQPGVPPEVVITINERQKQITISDNGKGMTLVDLKHFFEMHGQNKERAQGRIGRGMFGTGKSAAFGIANELTVTTIKEGKRTMVRLRRDEVEAMADGAPIPVAVLEAERPTGEPSGTVVDIREVHLRRLDRPAIIGYIERNLAHYPRDVSVFVDHHQCEFKAPDVAEVRRFRAEGDVARAIGDIELVISVARGPLDEELRGIQVFSHQNWHETTMCGSEGKPMSEYIFGEVDVPALEEYVGPIAPFDNTRSGRLNPENEVVVALYRFIGPHVDEVRRELVSRERERARSEEARRLAEQADRISEVLTADFADFRSRLRRVSSAVTGRDVGKRFEPLAGDGDGPWTEGGEQLASPIPAEQKQGSGADGSGTGEPPEFAVPVVEDSRGKTTGGPSGTTESSRRSPRGGFHVEYKNVGESNPRAKYVSDTRTITINLDHPQVAAAYALGGTNAMTFLRLAAEAATSEYAVGLAYEVIETYSDPHEAIYDIRDHVERVSRAFATLYATA